MSQAPNSKKLDAEGYTSKGVVTYTCCCRYDILLSNKDVIIFTQDFGNWGIKKENKFIVKMKDEGLYKGQYCYKFFDIELVGDVDDSTK